MPTRDFISMSFPKLSFSFFAVSFFAGHFFIHFFLLRINREEQREKERVLKTMAKASADDLKALFDTQKGCASVICVVPLFFCSTSESARVF